MDAGLSTQDIKRRMPLEDEWFDKKINDLLYGYMQSSATYNKEEKDEMKRLRWSKKEFKADMKNLTRITKVKEASVKLKIKKLISAGYLSEDVEYYYFPYNPDNFYLLIDRELLLNICSSMNENSLRIYVYLADKMRMKERTGSKKEYSFTLKELKIAFGYSEKSRAIESTLTSCLSNLAVLGIISYHAEYRETGNISNTSYKARFLILTDVAMKLPEQIEKKQEETNPRASLEDASEGIVV